MSQGSEVGGTNGLPDEINLRIQEKQKELQRLLSKLRRQELRDQFFKECAPTDERLKQLSDRWLNPSLLERRLLYCGPFVLMLEVPDILPRASSKLLTLPSARRNGHPTKFVAKSHHELHEYLQDGERETFINQMFEAWPKTFGSLIEQESMPPCFFWRRGSPHLDDGTSYICRKSVYTDDPPLLEYLFHNVNVSLHPTDDMVW